MARVRVMRRKRGGRNIHLVQTSARPFDCLNSARVVGASSINSDYTLALSGVIFDTTVPDMNWQSHLMELIGKCQHSKPIH